ncbi:hypothetical protein [Streptomyces sp. G7(2002)]|uniref:hypothetical protein n=1 Tax=Streptomyces sp. G7(2002) TaxID=2971798 RepID=UPI00237DE0E2|nr:hypothetical protein [Streptomyces sp. G7(2002)]WDT59237.1 hypothetical protein NUT86_37310 [Streptomyces sp. G7(2002)]
MEFNITAEEEALVHDIADRLRAGDSPTDDDLAEELGDEVRPHLSSLVTKGWLVVDAQRSLTLSRIARAAISSGRDLGGAQA